MLLFSSYLVSDSLPPGGLQHASLLCPPLSPGICSNPCPASQQRYLTILCRSLLLLTSIFPSTRVFSIKSALWIRQPKYWSFSFSHTSPNEYSELTGLISFQSKGFSRVFSSTTIWKPQFFSTWYSLWSNCHSGLDEKLSDHSSFTHNRCIQSISTKKWMSGWMNIICFSWFWGATRLSGRLEGAFCTVQSPSCHCDPVDRSTPGLSVPPHFPESAQVHVHCIGDAVRPSHPLMPSSPSALDLSQHQGLFQWVSCSHQMIKILELQLQHQSFQWVLRVDFP